MDVIVIKVLIALVGTLAFGVLYRLREQIERWPEPTRNRRLALAFTLCRLVPFVGIYLIAGAETRSDVPLFYQAAAEALAGKLVYRDFWSPYSPLFAYLTALPLVIWHSAKAVVLFMIGVEGLAWWLTYRLARRQVGARAHWVALLYLVLPAPLVFCVLGGQEDSWMWAFTVASLHLGRQQPDEFRLGMWMAVVLLATKALAVLIVAALFFWVRRPVRYVFGLAVVGLPALAVLYLLTGTGFLTPLMFAGMLFAPNIWTVLAPLTGDFMQYAGPLSTLGLLTVIAFSAVGAWRLRQQRVSYERSLPILWLLCYGFIMVVHKSSFSNYAFIYMLPLVFSVIDLTDSRQVGALLVLNALAAIQPSLWWSLDTPLFTNPAMLMQGQNLLEYSMEVCIVLSVAYFVWLAYTRIPTGSRPLSSVQTPHPSSTPDLKHGT
ncbi:hypothetical protein GCM10023187_23520 [Nibrella viscosa]|uniref:DUF2029 domain-containing protein n=1 Tax=Nibrella viscosa TaxID=1084524 RepID=A0ABP8KEF6_9BACT